MTTIRIRFKQLGIHTHMRVFVGEPGKTFAKAGDLVMSPLEANAFFTALQVGPNGPIGSDMPVEIGLDDGGVAVRDVAVALWGNDEAAEKAIKKMQPEKYCGIHDDKWIEGTPCKCGGRRVWHDGLGSTTTDIHWKCEGCGKEMYVDGIDA